MASMPSTPTYRLRQTTTRHHNHLYRRFEVAVLYSPKVQRNRHCSSVLFQATAAEDYSVGAFPNITRDHHGCPRVIVTEGEGNDRAQVQHLQAL